MLKTILTLFLFFSMAFAASLSVVSYIPHNLTTGSVYPLEYDICLNTPQEYTIVYNVSTELYNMSENGTEFNITNCTYQSIISSYLCNFTGIAGQNKIKQNLSMNLMAKKDNYSFISYVYLKNEATYGICNPEPVQTISSGSSGSSGGSGGSGGGWFSVPRTTTTKEEPKEEKNETKPVKEPQKEEPQIQNKTESPKEEPKIVENPFNYHNATILEITAPREEKQVTSPWYYLIIILSLVFVCLFVAVGWWFYIRKPPTQKIVEKEKTNMSMDDSYE